MLPVPGDQGQRRALDQRAEALFAFSQFALDLAALSHFSRQAQVQSDQDHNHHGSHQQDKDASDAYFVQRCPVGMRYALEHEAVQRIRRRQHAQLGVGRSNVPPAAGIHVPDLHQLRLHQPAHFLGFEQQVFAGFAPAVAGDDQVGDFGRMIHRILPAAQARALESRDAIRARAHLHLRREQRIAIEIDAARPGRKQVERNTGLFHQIGLIGGIARSRADLAGQQVVDVEGMRNHHDAVERQLFLLQIGDQLGLVRQQHDALVDQFVH